MQSKPNDVTRIEPDSSRVGETTVPGHPLPIAGTELELGSSFGRYVVVRKLGQGGMGVVYLAYDPQLDRGVALKVLRPGASSADRGAAQDRLLREAQAMARLSHPNVLPVYDVGMVDSHVFMAMEYVEGHTLGQWLEHDERSWREVIDVFVGAGKGLAAAHAAGLVHRDFKPENVMLGENVRPRVMDFGLARASDDDGVATQRERLHSGPLPSDSLPPDSIPPNSISSSEVLTRTGFVLGTPAYMAPEQHFGAAPESASDQFSFCVALHEALYGARPFDGETSAQLCKAAMRREVKPAPASSKVPGWLRRVVLRGLSPDIADRWPSMDALLAQLDRRRRSGGRTIGMASLGLVGVVATSAAWWPTQSDDPCAGSEEALASTWNDDTKASIHEAFAKTELAFAPEAAERTIVRLDTWSEAWTEQHRDACEATYVRHEQSDAGLDLRMRCLQDRRLALGSLSEVLGTAERGTVEHAVAVVERLPSPTYCADLEALAAEVPPPDDAIERERVEHVRAALARIDSLILAARFTEARTDLGEARSSAQGIEYPPLWIELDATEARVLEAEGSLPASVEALESTLWRAEALGMDRLVVSLASNLVRLDGAERNDYARAETWSALAVAKLDRLDAADPQRAYLEQCRGDLADTQGDYDRAAEHYRAAVELHERHEPGGTAHAKALGNFGKVHYRAGRLSEAASTFEHAATVLAEALGPEHPDVAKAIGNAATAHHVQGEYARAQEGFERSLELLENAYGPEHLAVAAALTNLGNVHHRQGHYAEAVEFGRRAIAIKDAQLGPGNPKSALNLNNVAMSLSELHEYEQALATYREASEAIATLGDEHIARVEPWIGEGETLMHLERPAEAIEPLQRAYALETAHGHDPKRRALPAFHLARALWDGDGDRARAHALVTDALEVLGDSETTQHRRLVDAMHTWQTEHPIR